MEVIIGFFILVWLMGGMAKKHSSATKKGRK